MLAGLIPVDLLSDGSPKGWLSAALPSARNRPSSAGVRDTLQNPQMCQGAGGASMGKRRHTNRASPTAKDAQSCTVSSKNSRGSLPMELVGIKSGWIWGPEHNRGECLCKKSGGWRDTQGKASRGRPEQCGEKLRGAKDL